MNSITTLCGDVAYHNADNSRSPFANLCQFSFESKKTRTMSFDQRHSSSYVVIVFYRCIKAAEFGLQTFSGDTCGKRNVLDPKLSRNLR